MVVTDACVRHTITALITETSIITCILGYFKTFGGGGGLLNKSESKLSPYYFSSELLFWGHLQEGTKVFLLDVDLLPGDGRSRHFYHLGVPKIDIFYINRP